MPLRLLREAMRGPERAIILRAFEACRWCRRDAAEALQIERTTLYKKMVKYGLFAAQSGRAAQWWVVCLEPGPEVVRPPSWGCGVESAGVESRTLRLRPPSGGGRGAGFLGLSG